MNARYPLTVALAGMLTRGRPLRPVEKVDLGCFMGPWRVIACMDNAMEHEMVDAVETYMLREDGRVEVHSSWREKSFSAEEQTHESVCTVEETGTNACWKIRPDTLLSTRFTILALHPQYEWAAMAHPSRKFGWVLARARTLDGHTYRQILRAFEQQGFDTQRFIKIPQWQRRESYMGAALPLPNFKCA